MLAKLNAAIDSLSALLLGGALVTLTALIAVNGLEVVSRYLLGSPTIWAYDLATLLNGALFMLGLAYTLRVGGHVRVDVFAGRLPRKLQRLVIALFFLLLLAPCLALIALVALEQTLAALKSGERLLSAWEPPLWPGYLAVTVGLFALLLQALSTAIRSLTEARDPLAPHDGGATERGPV